MISADTSDIRLSRTDSVMSTEDGTGWFRSGAKYAERPSAQRSPPALASGRASSSGRGQFTSSRSTTKISVSPGLIAPPAPRSP